METLSESPKNPRNDQTPESEPIIPSRWFAKNFPEVAKKHLEAMEEETNRDGIIHVARINEDYIAETIGELGTPLAPTVYLAAENRFYSYEPAQGIYVEKKESQILTRFSTLLRECATACDRRGFCDTKTLRFKLSNTSNLRGVIQKAKGFLHVDEDYFSADREKFIPCNNGMLQLSDMQLRPFAPEFRRRNKLAVNYDPNVKCPTFLDTLMAQSLFEEDILLLQKWFGLALIGKNLSQVIVILTGTPAGGKSTLVKIVVGVIGEDNVTSLRTDQLNGRFEFASFLGKTLLNAADVSANFLSHKSAAALKSLTGGDPMTVEIKNGNDRPEIVGDFNVIITSNTRLAIHLEADAQAWKRRLVIIEYRKEKPKEAIPSLAEIILREEGSGVLNWGLEGLIKLRADDWRINLSDSQSKIVESALLESDSPHVFVQEGLEKDESSKLTCNDCFDGYVAFCKARNWNHLQRREASEPIENWILTTFGIGCRHDMVDSTGTSRRGWY